MTYPLQVTGRTIEVCKYRVDYTVTFPSEEDGTEPLTEELSRLIRTQDAAAKFAGRVNGTVVENDTAAYDWLDGMTIPADAASPMDAAVAMAKMGQAAYEARQANAAAAAPEQLRADVDYIAVITGVTL